MTSVRGGRLPGQTNFKEAEDVALAEVYAKETVDAVGTDQNGTTFWEKIHVGFMVLMPGSTRSAVSLSNKWNNVINKRLGKWVGHLAATLREYQCGWQYDDYVRNAQLLYTQEIGQKFKFGDVYGIVRKLPKYAVPVDGIETRVKAAIGLDDVLTGDGEIPVVAFASRPSIGKKAAKKAKLSHGGGSDELDPDLAALPRMAAATEAENELFKEQMEMDKTNSRIAFFKMDPESAASKRFYAMQAAAFLKEMEVGSPQAAIFPEVAIAIDETDGNTMESSLI